MKSNKILIRSLTFLVLLVSIPLTSAFWSACSTNNLCQTSSGDCELTIPQTCFSETECQVCDCFSENPCSPDCVEDSDCGETEYADWENYCDEDDVHKIRKITYKKCESGICKETYFWEDQFVKQCIYGCVNGECINECTKDTDCGTGSYVGEKYCKNNNVYQDYQFYECLNNQCKSKTETRLVEKCNSCQECKNGKCLDNYQTSKCSREKTEINLCGDSICDPAIGENEITCSEDCKKTKTASTHIDASELIVDSDKNSKTQELNPPIYLIPLILLILLTLIFIILTIFLKK